MSCGVSRQVSDVATKRIRCGLTLLLFNNDIMSKRWEKISSPGQWNGIRESRRTK